MEALAEGLSENAAAPHPGNDRLIQGRTRSFIIITSALILLLAFTAIIVLLVYRNRESRAAGGRAAEAYLNDYHGHTGAASYRLDVKPNMLGRVAGQDSQHLHFIVIPESTIGRRHARIDYKGGGYWISDQGSINGTFVNDRRITAERRLKHGDKLRLHKYEFEFIMPQSSGAGAAVVSAAPVSAKQTAGVEVEALLQEVREELSQAAAELDLDLDLAADEVPGAKAETPTADAVEDTLMPGEAMVDDLENGAARDETLMPGVFESVDEGEGDVLADEDFFDLSGEGKKEKRK